jgi:hypothetical protein
MVQFLGVLGLFGLGLAAYTLVYQPLQKHKRDQAKLEDDRHEKQEQLVKVMRDLKRVETVKKRSLPADPDVAKREYEAALGYILRSSGVPAGYTIVPKVAGDVRSIPDIAPKKPAYQRIGYDIRMTKVDLPILTKVLKAYYDLNLLHQITHLDIKRVEKEGSSGGIARRGADRQDLEVTFHTEAIILDGAEQRRTLTAVPLSVAAVGGGGAYHAVLNMPETSRVVKPQQFVQVLATDASKLGRDYALLEGRDVFHGPLPPPERKAEAPKPVNPFGPEGRPKEDISPFIRFNSLTTGATGIQEATIWNQAYNTMYELRLRDGDGYTEFQVSKKFRVGEKWVKDREAIKDSSWQPLKSAGEFTIGEDDTATARTFRFLGVHEDGLVLIEKTTEDKPADPKKAAGKDRPAPPAKLGAEQVAVAAAVGVVGANKPAKPPAVTESVFVWKLGQTLKAITPLSESEGRELIRKLSPKQAAGAELAPKPRDAEN